MREVTRRWLRPLRFLVAALLLAWLFSRFPLPDVGAVLRSVDPLTILVGSAAAVAAQIVASLRLGIVARHHGLSLGAVEACRINFAAAFYGLTVPGGNLAGGAVRVYRLGEGTKPIVALAAVFADRIYATFGALLAGSMFWLLDPAARPPAIGAVLLGLTAAVPALYLLGRTGGPLAVRLPEKWARGIGRESEVAPLEAVGLVGMTLFAQLLGLIGVVAAALAIGLDLSPLTLGWVRTAVMLLVMLPISIAGFGVREGALVAVLAQYGVAGEQAVAFSLLMFVITTLVNGAVGGALEAAGVAATGRVIASGRAAKRSGGRADDGARVPTRTD